MGLVGDLFGLLISGGTAAGGKIAYTRAQRKKADAWKAEQDAKYERQLTEAQARQAAHERETRSNRAKLEALIGGSLEENWQKPRPYALLREYDLTMQYLDEMFRAFRRQHPAGSELIVTERQIEVQFGTPRFVSVLKSKLIFLPVDAGAYDTALLDAFLRHEYDTFVGPYAATDGYGGRNLQEITYGVPAGLYALGKARKQLIREGFCPSNCGGTLWENWNPYISWDGLDGVMNNRFKSAYDIRPYVPYAEYSQNLRFYRCLLHLGDRRYAVETMQNSFQQQHPEFYITKGELMNKQRRARIMAVKEKIESLSDDISSLQEEEQDYFDNIPENLQNSEKAELSEAALDALGEAYDSIINAIEALETAAE